MNRLLPVMSLVGCLVSAPWLAAAEPTAPPTKAQVEALLTKAQDWLLAQQQPDGAFLPGKQFVIGVTAMSVEVLAKPPLAITKDDPRLAKAIALLKSNVQPDGGTYAKEEGLGNYGTSFTLMALAAAKVDDSAWILGGQKFLFGGQNTTADSVAEGGMGYGSKGAGHEDLTNTSSAVAALKATGVPASDPHMQQALAFIQRCQNLSSHNKLPWVTNDGGAVYSPEESKAAGSWNPKDSGAGGTSAAEVKLKSYGSMTYALISSYLALDIKADDPRVAAALAWVKDNYQFEANPGMAAGKELEGLLYYYAAMAKTFDTLGLKVIDLKDGTKADWRADLFAAISKRAVPAKLDDGREGIMWINSAKRWGEGLPHLATIYLIKALKTIHGSL
ncbi:MAG TPA: prenyltransferase/squalene oxidase repeat-containing protein [Planctomycetota bacterium]|nr:prenyltransferase/squalene oxidase repeat-containing protein [Planctomycetota bacterium]